MSIRRYLSKPLTEASNNALLAAREPTTSQRLESQRGFNQFLLGTTKANAVHVNTTGNLAIDSEAREGWVYTNPVLGNALDILIFNGTNETLAIRDIKTLFVECSCDKINSAKSAPQITIYTKPTGSGDLDPTYHATLTYKFNASGGYKLGESEEVNFCSTGSPVQYGMDLSSRYIQLETTASNNAPTSSEEIAFIRVETDATCPANECEIRLISAGFEAIDSNTKQSQTSRRIKFLGTDIQKVDIEDATISGTGLATEPKQDDMISLLQGQTPAANRPKVIPVSLCVGNSGSQHSSLRAVGGDLSVYIDDCNPDVAVNSGLARSLYQTDGSQKSQAMGTDGASQFQLKTDSDGHLQVEVLTAPTTTVSGTVAVSSVSGTVTVDGSGFTQPISASSLPLPTGASTSANQATANASLSTISGDTTSLDTKITSGSDSTLSSAVQVLSYGNNSGTLRPLKVGSNGELTTEIDHSWTTSTIISLQAVADSASVQGDFDLGQGISHELTPIKFFVTNSASVDVAVVLQTSPDNSNWYDDASGAEIAVSSSAFSFTQEDGGAGDGHRYIRCIVQNNDGGATSTNVQVIVGYYA